MTLAEGGQELPVGGPGPAEPVGEGRGAGPGLDGVEPASPRDAIRAVAGRVFLLDPDPKATVEQDVEAAVTERLRMDDLSGSRHAVDRWAAFVVILPARTQHRDDHPSFALEAVGDHLPVTGLEDVQGQHGLREEDDVGEREDGEAEGAGGGQP